MLVNGSKKAFKRARQWRRVAPGLSPCVKHCREELAPVAVEVKEWTCIEDAAWERDTRGDDRGDELWSRTDDEENSEDVNRQEEDDASQGNDYLEESSSQEEDVEGNDDDVVEEKPPWTQRYRTRERNNALENRGVEPSQGRTSSRGCRFIQCGGRETEAEKMMGMRKKPKAHEMMK